MKTILVFFGFLTLFSLLQFTIPNIIGFDGYYHIKTAELIKENGFFKEFPWVKNTILSENYADIQVLFRILLIPFTFFGLDLGAKISSIIFSVVSFMIFYWFLSKNKINYPFFWTLLYLFTSSSLMFRFMLPRQMPLVIAALILTIYFLQIKKYFPLALVSIFSILLHSSFVFQLVIIFLYFLLEKIFKKKFDFKLLIYPFFGTIIGLIINPYFPSNISFLYTQIFEVNLAANLFNVEWQPWPFLEFIKNNMMVLFYFAISIFILIKNKKITQTQTFYFLLAIFFLIYTLLSRRMQEYLVPFSILAVSFFVNDYFNKENKIKFPSIIKKGSIIILIILISINFISFRNYVKNNDFLHNFDQCAAWMKDNIPKDSLVFINAYAFPYLFSKNSEIFYTHGIDLTYSHLHDAEKFKRYMAILQGTLSIDEDYIVQDYNPDYVFSGKVEQDVQLFNYIISHKENYRAVYEDDWCAVLEVN